MFYCGNDVLSVFNFDGSHLICRLLILPSMSRCPAEYCSITSLTSYGRRVSLNFLLATRNFRILRHRSTLEWPRMQAEWRRSLRGITGKDKTGILQTKANSCEESHEINKCNKINYREEPYQFHEWLMKSQHRERENSSSSSLLLIILVTTPSLHRGKVWALSIVWCDLLGTREKRDFSPTLLLYCSVTMGQMTMKIDLCLNVFMLH